MPGYIWDAALDSIKTGSGLPALYNDELVTSNLFRRRGRFVFTLLGISIGMAAFVALLTLGENMRGEIRMQAEGLGANLLIMPENICVYNQMAIVTGDTISELMAYDVYEKIKPLEGITVIPHLTQKTAVKDSPVVIVGILPMETLDFRGWQIADGTYFSSPDEAAVILGARFAIRHGLDMGDVLTVRGEPLPVKGILGMTESNDDDAMFIPLGVTQRLFEKEGYISYMSARVADLARMDAYIAAIMDVANVQAATDDELLASVLSILSTVNATLQMIAGVSLFAAAFGIINTMMMAVFERRREIGILCAIGGKNSTIFKIFLFESGIYGLLGGICGVIMGVAVSFLAAPVINQGDAVSMLKGASVAVTVDFRLILLAISLSLFISVLSGLYPALKAAKLTPVEAMNHE
jgi:putative ABC transport system permease protein